MRQGFGIVEAMVVVTIIGILVALGYSRFNYHVAKVRQAEAKNNLEHIVMLQESFIIERQRYSWLKSIGLKRLGGGHACGTGSPGEEMRNELGFRPSNCTELRYEYWMPPKWAGGVPLNEPRVKVDGGSPSYLIRADSFPQRTNVYIWPDCNERDMWKVQKGVNKVKQTDPNRNVLKVCE